MKYLTILLSHFLLLYTCSFAQTEAASNGLNDTAVLTAKQTESVYQQSQFFPNNTQLSIALVKEDGIKFYGIKRIEDQIVQVENQDSVFEIGSISKVFTATLLSSLVHHKKVNLDAKLSHTLGLTIPEESDFTLKQLANHTSGLPRLPSNMDMTALLNPSNPYKKYDVNKLESYLTEHINLQATPGTQNEYSNLGAGILAYTLGKINNKSYQELLNEHIFSPYGMSNSSSNRADIEDLLVGGLSTSGNPSSNWDFNALEGAGAILSCTKDMAQFLLAQLDTKNEILNLSKKLSFQINEKMSIGLGWHILHQEGDENIHWHNGGTGGYTASMALDMENKVGVVILSNVTAFHPNMANIDALCFQLLKNN